VYQGEATIRRADGSQASADVTIWHDDFGAHSGWGGRAAVRLSDSLVNDVGSACTIRWPVSGGGYVAGEFVLSVGRVGEGVETYRLAGSGELSEVGADP
jgi:hypothetical protein